MMVFFRSDASIADLLHAFCSKDHHTSARAFEQLSVLTRRGLCSYLRGKLHSLEAREDVIQEVLRKIWTRRDQFENRGASAWWRLVKQAADQCRIDYVRKVGLETQWDDNETGEIPETESTAIDLLLDTISEHRSFYRLADELWLGFSAQHTDEQRARGILAAKLFYVEGLPWDDVCSILNQNGQDSILTRSELDTWLGSAAIIRSLAFQILYQSNDNLTGFLLGLNNPDARQLNDLTNLAMSVHPSAPPLDGWTWEEIRVILWRYRDAERQDRILANELCTLNKSELTEFFDRCLQKFPFISLMNRLCDLLAKWPNAQKELADHGLWQRLVIEYYCRDTTQHRDIFERTSPAAELAPYHLTTGMLNVWLSNGRLLAKLVAYVEAQGVAG